MTVFRSKPLLAMRYQVDLIAPPPVAAAAEAAYQRLREIRETIVTTSLNVRTSHSADRGSAEWEAVHNPYINAIGNLRTAMRQDVQGSYIIPVE
ncbi:MAG TPA: hypothetical protein DGT23_16315 [Micromonosporaceae bacterium]|nr:hypothetical protein [Micromonosporaceae bacterium]